MRAQIKVGRSPGKRGKGSSLSIEALRRKYSVCYSPAEDPAPFDDRE
jgi:hypothetical protein